MRLQLLRCLKHLFLLEKETIIAFICVLKIYDKHRWLQLCCRFFFKQKKHIKIHQSKTTKYIPEKANFTTAKTNPRSKSITGETEFEQQQSEIQPIRPKKQNNMSKQQR